MGTGERGIQARYGLPVLIRATTLSALALALAPGAAIASSGDVGATHAYIQANYPLARAGSPENEVAQPMSYEVAVALWAVAYGTAAGPIRTFVSAVRPLRWSNQRITRIAHQYATSLHELSTLPVPDLCADVRAWTANGFHTVPANVAQLDRRLEAIEGESVPQKLLAPFERGSDAGVAARTRGLEVKLAETEFMVGQTD